MKKLLFLFLVSFTWTFSPSQNLLPHIGLASVPADSESICTIPWYLGGFDASGYQVGDTVHDFTLYDLNGTPFHLGSHLGSGKPVLLIAGSYTCPVFRGKFASINQVVATYGSQVDVAVIYGVEAHPTDTSPYFGQVNIGTANQNAGILYPQPTTYGERKQIATDMLNALTLNAPVFLDGPCNAWWSHFGPAPNNAYLIDTNGIVFAKHAWYDRYPDDIECDIDSLLGNTGPCGGGTQVGSFTLQMLSADTVYGVPGATLSIDLDLINNSSDDVLVFMRRLQNNMAVGWSSSMCADVCYSINTDSTTILIPRNTTQNFHFYFYSGPTPGISSARMGWRNVNNTNNSFARNFWGITTAVGIEEGQNTTLLTIYPNPTSSQIHIQAPFEIAKVIVMDAMGREVAVIGGNELDVSRFAVGLYHLVASDGLGKVSTGSFWRK